MISNIICLVVNKGFFFCGLLSPNSNQLINYYIVTAVRKIGALSTTLLLLEIEIRSDRMFLKIFTSLLSIKRNLILLILALSWNF